MARTTLTSRVTALESKVDDILAAVQALAPAKSAPARGKAKSDADPFPVALAKSRTMRCVAPAHWSGRGKSRVHKGRRSDGMFTPNGAAFHADNGGDFE